MVSENVKEFLREMDSSGISGYAPENMIGITSQNPLESLEDDERSVDE